MPTLNILANNCFVNAAGQPIGQGLLVVRPSSPFQVTGAPSQQASTAAVYRTITNGSLSSPLALFDPQYASPQNFGYTFEIIDETTQHSDTYSNVLIANDGNGNYDLANLNTGNYVSAAPVTPNVINVLTPATAPVGSCAGFEGKWAFGQDGTISFADPNTHIWNTISIS